MLTLNLSICFTLFMGSLFKSIFLGKLRDVEVELLIDRLKYYIMEVSLALTIFRNELNLVVMAEFLLLLFLKSFHWLAKARLEYLEQILPIPFILHIRQISLLGVLMLADVGLGYYCLNYTMSKGKSVLILFGFECGLLTLSIMNVLSRYFIQLIDNQLVNGLRSKGLYIMLLDLLTDALVFITYVCFFFLVFHYYGLPLHIIRETWIAFTVFHRRLNSFIKYLRLLNNIEARFPDASQEEIANAGDCLVCREGFGDGKGKRLPCSHVFHLDCLRMWLQHQQTCPLCRADIPVHSLDAAVQRDHPRNHPRQPGNEQRERDIPAEAVHEMNRLGVNGNDQGPEAAHILDKTAKSAAAPAETTPELFPAFFVAAQELPVSGSTTLSPETTRRVLGRGAVVFALRRVIADTGLSWLQLSDGFVLEGSRDGALRLMLPYRRQEEGRVRQSATLPYHLREITAMLPQTVSWKVPKHNIPSLQRKAANEIEEGRGLSPESIRAIASKLQEISQTLAAMQEQLHVPAQSKWHQVTSFPYKSFTDAEDNELEGAGHETSIAES